MIFGRINSLNQVYMGHSSRYIFRLNISVVSFVKFNLGKTYIKKVFENIRETVPRLIGQNLLK